MAHVRTNEEFMRDSNNRQCEKYCPLTKDSCVSTCAMFIQAGVVTSNVYGGCNNEARCGLLRKVEDMPL